MNANNVDRNHFFSGLDPLSSLRPSSMMKQTMASRFLHKIHRDLSYFFSPERHNYRGIAAAFDRTSATQQTNAAAVDPSELHSYFARFIKGQKHSPKTLHRCINGLDKQLKHLEKIKRMQLMADFGLPGILGSSKRLEKTKAAFNAKLVKKIAGLKEGEKKLILVSNQPGDSLYYLFSKDNQQLSLKVIGRGETMADLTKSETQIEGKACIRPILSYTNLPEGAALALWLSKMIDNTSLHSSFDPANFSALTTSLVPAVDDKAAALVKKTDSFAKTLWTAFKEIHVPQESIREGVKNPAKAINRRLHLRVELGILFDLFKGSARNLKANTEEFEAITTLMREVSAHVLSAHEKGYLSSEDLKEIMHELTIIHDTCRKTQQVDVPALLSLQKLEMGSLAALSMEGVKEVVEVPEVAVPMESAPDEIAPPPPQTVLPETVMQVVPQNRIDTLKGATEAIQTLIDSPVASMTDVGTVIRLIGFRPLKEKKSYSIDIPEHERLTFDPKSFFVQCTKDEAKQLIEQFHGVINKFFTPQAIEKLSIKAFRAQAKILSMILFLSYRLDPFILIYGSEEFKNDEEKKKLFGGISLHQWRFSKRSFPFYIPEGYRKERYDGDNSNFHYNFMRYISRSKEQIHLKSHDPLNPGQLPPLKEIPDAGKAHNEKRSFPAMDSFYDLKKILPRLLRPFPDPSLLAAAYSYQIFYDRSSYGQEAIRDNVQRVLDQYIEEYNRTKDIYVNERDQVLESRPVPLQKKELSFADEDLKELLLMQIGKSSQEIFAFIKQYPHLLKNPSVRHFIDITYLRQPYGFYELDKEIADQITELIEATKKDPELIDQLVFLLDFNDKIEGSFKHSLQAVEGLLQRIENKEMDRCYLPRLWMQHLRHLFEKDKLSPKEVETVLIEYNLLKDHPGIGYDADPILFQFFEDRYSTLIKTLGLNPQANGDINAFHAILNKICAEKGKPLNKLTWEYHEAGFPKFTNGEYVFDLATSTLSLANHDVLLTSLPIAITNDPLFKQTYQKFPVDGVASKAVGDSTIYFFKNEMGCECRIEREDENIRYYKKVDGEWLQALSSHQFLLNTGNGKPQKISLKTLLTQEKRQEIHPDFLKSNLYANPKEKNTVYHVSAEGKKLFRIDFKTKKHPIWHDVIEKCKKVSSKTTKVTPAPLAVISGIFDMRGSPESGPWKVVNAQEMKEQEPFKTLSSIEHPGHMIVWGKKKKIEKIELPRCGLEFSVQGDKLICTDTKYKGYHVKIGAPASAKLGLPFSILLEHSDPTRPKVVLMPDASVIKLREYNSEIASLTQGSKISRLIHMLKALISVVFKKEIPRMHLQVIPDINPEHVFTEPYAIELRPRTEQIIYKNDKIPTIINMLQHAVRTNEFEAGLKLLDELDFTQKKLSSKEKQALASFLSFKEVSSPSEAALKLKYIAKVLGFIDTKAHKDLTKYEQLQKHLIDRIPNLITVYRSEKKLNRALHLKEKEISLIDQACKAPAVASEPSHEEGNSMDAAIKELEQALQVNQPPPIESFSRTLALMPGKGERLLFDASDLGDYLIEEQIALPKIDLQMPQDGEPCEEEAVRQLRESLALDQGKIELTTYVSGSKTSQQKLVDKVLEPKIKELAAQAAQSKRAYQHILTHTNDPKEQANFLSQRTMIPSDSMLMFAVMSKDGLQALKDQKRLPESIDIDALKAALLDYYDKEVQLNIAKICHAKLLQRINDPGDPADVSKLESKELFQLLTATRRYSIKENPELLCFEMLNFMAFRKLNDTTDQLDLMVNILKHPERIIQAGTGSGKTTVLSVLRGLMKPQGRNLVILNVLPGLIKQTISKMHELLEDPLKVPIHEFQFNLGKDLFDEQKNSIFKGIYLELLQTIQEKGCLVTDYKSLPLLEEKWIQLNRELSSLRKQSGGLEGAGEETRKHIENLKTHVEYLRKILALLGNFGDTMMDEFDQPSRPVHRLQIALGEENQRPSKFFTDKFPTLYELFAEDPELRLKENLQQDMSPEARKECIKRAAQKMAGLRFGFTKKVSPEITQEDIFHYLIGAPGGDSLLTRLDKWSLEQKDELAFYKEQFCEFAPLTLGYSRKSKYVRSQEGTKVLPCLNGKINEGSKFGNWMEEFNYCVQDYHQSGITFKEMKNWVSAQLKRKNAERLGMREKRETEAEKQFFDLFGKRLTTACATDKGIEQLLQQASSKEGKKIFDYFLQNQLLSFFVSGEVISMTPQNIASMYRVVSGISATIGSPDSLHKGMQADRAEALHIQKESLYKLYKKLDLSQGVLTYKPERAMDLFATLPQGVSSIIDGAGAFKEFPPSIIAQKLLESNPQLRGVGYVQSDGSIAYVGENNPPPAQKGFFFSEADTVGLDIELGKTKFAFTVKDEGDLEWMCQHVGRSRLAGQQLIPVCSAAITPRTMDEIIVMKLRYQAKKQAGDIYSAKIQEMQNILRSHARQRLLEIADFEQYLDEFEKMQDLFITPAAATYEEPGSYFAKHSQYRRKDLDPIEQLDLQCNKIVERSKALGLHRVAAELLEAQNNYKTLVSKLPSRVEGVDGEKETELHIEQELEQERQVEQQQERQVENEVDIERAERNTNAKTYLPREKTNLTHKVCEVVNDCYSPLIEMSDQFLQLSRKGKDPMHERKPFDQRMYRVGKVNIVLATDDGTPYKDTDILYKSHPTGKKLSKISLIIEDVVRRNREDDDKQCSFSVDIRTGKYSCLSISYKFHSSIDQSLLDRLNGGRRNRYPKKLTHEILSSPEVQEDLSDIIGNSKPSYEEWQLDYFSSILRDIPVWRGNLGKAILSLPEVQEAFVQIKFLDARTTGYTEKELIILEKWIKKSGVKKMRRHFENDILRYRDEVRRHFPKSQLWELFEKLAREELAAQGGISQ